MPAPVSANFMRWLRLQGKSSLESFLRGRGSIAILSLFLTVTLVGCSEKEAREAPKPPDVEVAEVITQDVPVFHETVAQLNGPVNADITPKVQGYLLSQDYMNGAFVKKGQLLFRIDPRPFEAALDQAKADVERAMASLAKANNDVERDTPLAAQSAIPQKQLDDDKAAQNWSTAQVAASKAQQQQAELNLGWTKVYSPVNGIAGVANSQIGDLVGTSTKMTTVSQIDPIWAYFNVSESTYLAFASQIRRALQKTATTPVAVEYIQANDVPYPFKGKLIFINREITAGTGTIQLAAAFPNQDAILRPGGFGRVRVQTATSRNAMLVPQAAVIEVQSQYQIIVVSPDNKATVRPVKVGDRVGSKWIITEGLKPGEKVVVEGIQKVQTFAAQSPQSAKEGIPVTPKPYVAELDGSS
ncbi:MAG TPA: efflux RND transporter periplasmic adaptor subunit [Terriglobales bacterium]|nr:efflux RND transporter periplasmic adaptor subunit [Terriglobales bacterium]